MLVNVVGVVILSMIRNAPICGQNKVNFMNVKVVNLMSRVNERGFLVHLELCECKCGLNKIVCNSKQKWNHDKCHFECTKFP